MSSQVYYLMVWICCRGDFFLLCSLRCCKLEISHSCRWSFVVHLGIPSHLTYCSNCIVCKVELHVYKSWHLWRSCSFCKKMYWFKRGILRQLCTHLDHFFPVSIHSMQCIHCLLQEKSSKPDQSKFCLEALSATSLSICVYFSKNFLHLLWQVFRSEQCGQPCLLAFLSVYYSVSPWCCGSTVLKPKNVFPQEPTVPTPQALKPAENWFCYTTTEPQFGLLRLSTL